jgi:ABC-type transporter Mla subunit MlaD
MTDPITPDPTEPTPAGTPGAGETTPPADETFSWTDDRADGGAADHDQAHEAAGSATTGAAATATAVLEQLRVAIDDIAERATPTVREFSARAAELAATAADRAAPFAQRAGEVTSEASSKLAERSRSWAADLRASIPGEHPEGHSTGEGPLGTSSGTPDVTPPPPAPEAESGSGEGASPA